MILSSKASRHLFNLTHISNSSFIAEYHYQVSLATRTSYIRRLERHIFDVIAVSPAPTSLDYGPHPSLSLPLSHIPTRRTPYSTSQMARVSVVSSSENLPYCFIMRTFCESAHLAGTWPTPAAVNRAKHRNPSYSTSQAVALYYPLSVFLASPLVSLYNASALRSCKSLSFSFRFCHLNGTSDVARRSSYQAPLTLVSSSLCAHIST